uniref:Uncharacterized protein n=1 Tax=Schizaphis graminum TaxID=13262 RepID=A0A2S2NPA9_SCHGA
MSFHFSLECYITGFKKVLKPGSMPKKHIRKLFSPLSIQSEVQPSTSSVQLSLNKETIDECEQIITVGVNDSFEKDFGSLVETSITNTIDSIVLKLLNGNFQFLKS